MKIAFYLARYGKPVDKIIDICSGRMGVAHVELIFSDGWWYSSSSRDGGCRFKRIELDYKWRAYDLNVSVAQESLIRLSAQKTVDEHVKYNWAGVFGFVLPIRDDPSKLFCSETCIQRLQDGMVLSRCPSWRVAPSTLELIVLSSQGVIKL